MDIILEMIKLFVFEKIYTTDLYSKVKFSSHIMMEYLVWINFYFRFKIIMLLIINRLQFVNYQCSYISGYYYKRRNYFLATVNNSFGHDNLRRYVIRKSSFYKL